MAPGPARGGAGDAFRVQSTRKMSLFPSAQTEYFDHEELEDYQMQTPAGDERTDLEWAQYFTGSDEGSQDSEMAMAMDTATTAGTGGEATGVQTTSADAAMEGAKKKKKDTTEALDFVRGAMSRAAADKLLRAWNVAGGFLCRFSDTENCNVLSYMPEKGGVVEHHVLRKNEEKAGVWELSGVPLKRECSDIRDAVYCLMHDHHPKLTARLIRQVPREEDKKLTPLQKAAQAVLGDPNDMTAKRMLQVVLEQHLKEKAEADVHTWLQQQVMDASMDHKDGHIANLLLWVKSYIEQEQSGSKMAVCFCGPSMLAAMIKEAAEGAGGSVEFNAEFQ
jgi:hypothetical protein